MFHACSWPCALLSLMVHFYRLSRLDEPDQQQVAVNEPDATKTVGDSLANSRSSADQQITTPAPSNCYGQWSTPKGCNVTAGQCEYHVVWTYSSKTDYMRFTITTTHTTLWTGIGFSDNHKMVNDAPRWAFELPARTRFDKRIFRLLNEPTRTDSPDFSSPRVSVCCSDALTKRETRIELKYLRSL